MSTLYTQTEETTPTDPVEASSATTWPAPTDTRTVTHAILAIVATAFALHWAQKFFIPLFLGIVVAYTLNPLVVWLERMKIPRVVGTSLVMLALVSAGALAALSLREQAQRILDQVPEAASRLSVTLRDMADQPNAIQKVQAAAREIEQATSEAVDGLPIPKKTPTRVVLEQPSFKLVDLLWTGSLGVFGIIGETVILLLLVFFLLLSGATIKRKLLKVTGPSLSKKKITVGIWNDVDRSIQNYMFTLLISNVLLTLFTWIAFRAIGLDNAGAWAVAAGVLHFIPYLGPAVTAFATGMAGFMQFGSFTLAVLVSGSSLVIAAFVGIILVTWMSCKMCEMNAAAVFISLLFWGWLWGAWGLLLAIPIMGMVKVFAEHLEDLHPLAELLSE